MSPTRFLPGAIQFSLPHFYISIEGWKNVLFELGILDSLTMPRVTHIAHIHISHFAHGSESSQKGNDILLFQNIKWQSKKLRNESPPGEIGECGEGVGVILGRREEARMCDVIGIVSTINKIRAGRTASICYSLNSVLCEFGTDTDLKIHFDARIPFTQEGDPLSKQSSSTPLLPLGIRTIIIIISPYFFFPSAIEELPR